VFWDDQNAVPILVEKGGFLALGSQNALDSMSYECRKSNIAPLLLSYLSCTEDNVVEVQVRSDCVREYRVASRGFHVSGMLG
jgi:hypothetical protein